MEPIKLCDSLGVDFLASVFDTEMLDFVIDHTPHVKIASGYMKNLSLLRTAAETGKPLLVSTGFWTLFEIRTVVTKPADAELEFLIVWAFDRLRMNLQTSSR